MNISEALRIFKTDKNFNWSQVDLTNADLSRVDLRWTDLSRVNLRDANLSGVNLSGANLSGVDLRWANLSGANLSKANLRWANLRWANLSGANLSRADLREAYLRRVNLTDTILPTFQLPKGDLIVWKSCSGVIVKLLIPEDAKRTASLVGSKCRAEYARVLEIEGAEEAFSSQARQYIGTPFVYRLGEIVRPHDYSDDIRVECAPGIHFYKTRQEAIDSGF